MTLVASLAPAGCAVGAKLTDGVDEIASPAASSSSGATSSGGAPSSGGNDAGGSAGEGGTGNTIPGVPMTPGEGGSGGEGGSESTGGEQGSGGSAGTTSDGGAGGEGGSGGDGGTGGSTSVGGSTSAGGVGGSAGEGGSGGTGGNGGNAGSGGNAGNGGNGGSGGNAGNGGNGGSTSNGGSGGSGGGATTRFVETAGLLVVEAENYDDSEDGTMHAWELRTDASASGGEAMQALDDLGLYYTAAGFSADAPRLDYNVRFTTTGTYYIWVRNAAVDDNGDSVHLGLNGMEVTSAMALTGSSTNTGYPLQWDSTDNGGTVRTLVVSTAGDAVLNLWMREDGVTVDKILLTTSSTYPAPTGAGPNESMRAP